MSNATQHSRQSGDSRRRRSRGGKNRNNQHENRQGGERRGTREDRGSGRSEEFRPQGERSPRGRPPVQLSWWQKLLKAIGLYKEPVRPPRPERKPDATTPEARAPKSNVRNARNACSGEGEGREASAERTPRRERGERSERGGRGGERSRGGDASTVESARVYVGNLSYDVTEQDLQELFKGIGGVRNVEIVYNRSTHRSKGYGFVEMLHKDEAVRSVEVLHDQPFMGRKLTVSGAKSKGQDEREESEERPERESRVVSLAPLPAAAAVAAAADVETETESEPTAEIEAEPTAEPTAEVMAETAAVEAEPEIQTIIETVTESDAEETPAEETEPKSEVA